MKKITLFGTLAFLAMGLSMTSCSSDPEFDDNETINIAEGNFTYDKDGVWSENGKAGFLNIDDYVFSHYLDEWEYVYGFTPSKATDTSLHTPLYSFPYAAAAGGGVNGPGSPYLVGYWAEYLEGPDCPVTSRTCRIYDEDGDLFQPQSVMVCVNTYLKYAALNGTDFSLKFTAGDYVSLNAYGVHEDGTIGEATFDLIYVTSDDVESDIETAWKEFDLRGLGTCTDIYFTMDASENLKNEYGLLIPTYFCIDKLTVKE